jgi:ABC-type multidrug transport system ATPase subunit
MPAIAIDSLAKSYGHIRALAGVSFEIEKGK